MTEILWPSAEAVARAIVAAARLEDEDPILTLEGNYGMRGRVYAMLALAHAFPTAPRVRLAICVGARAASAYKFLSNVRNIVRGRNRQKWFDAARLNAVCAELGWPKMSFTDAEKATFAVPVDAPAVGGAEPVLPAPTVPEESVDERSASVERMKAWKAATPPSRAPAPKAQLPALIPSKAARDLAAFVRSRNAPPARSAEVLDGEAMGEPPFERSALLERLKETGGSVERVAEVRSPDEVYVDGWMMAEAKKRNDARAAAQEQEGANV